MNNVVLFCISASYMHNPEHVFSRNVLAESARIARGNITDLAKLSASHHDAVIFPGGFGAAKNL